MTKTSPENTASPIVRAEAGKVVADSRDVAAFFGKRHDNVLRDIDNLISAAPSCLLNFLQTSIPVQMPNGGTRQERCFDITRDGFTLLAMGFTGKRALAFKLAYISAYNEMETALIEPTAPALPDFGNPAVAARAWAEQFEQRAAAERRASDAEAAAKAAAPAVEFVQNFVVGTGLKGFRQTARLIGADEREFRAFLKDKRIMYRLGGEWTAYDHHINAGRFRVTTGVNELTGHVFTQCRFTPKGVEWIAGEWAKRAVKQAIAAEAAAQSPDLISFGQSSSLVQ